MKHFIVTLLVGFWLLGPHAFADVSAKNGISITTASTINGKTPNSAFNGLTIVSGGGAWYDITADTSTNANDSTLASVMVWDAVTLPTGTATKIRVYIRTYSVTGGIRLGLYNSGGTLLDSGTVSVTGTGYFDVTISAAVTAGSYYVAKIPQGNNDFAVGYDNSTGSADYKTGETPYTLPGALPTTEGPFTGAYAFGVFVI